MTNRQNEIETDRKINGDCCLCDGEYTFYGNNANPLAEGQCCNDCNNKVIDARLGRLQKPKLKLKLKTFDTIFDRVIGGYFRQKEIESFAGTSVCDKCYLIECCCEADRLQKIADDENAKNRGYREMTIKDETRWVKPKLKLKLKSI